jgi:hypothetical protein
VRRHVEEHGIARRANAILLLDKGKSCAEIAEFLHLFGNAGPLQSASSFRRGSDSGIS